MIDPIDFESDSFSDIGAKDKRYDARAYALLMDVFRYLAGSKKHVSAGEILFEFRERTLEQYGPMSRTVLSEWGLGSCEDIGEMMLNLVESRRIGRDEGDSPEEFRGGYDFDEAFADPYEV